MITSFSLSSHILSYSLLTMVAPIAVSSASVKPNFLRAVRIELIPDPSKLAIKEGARDAITGSPL